MVREQFRIDVKTRPPSELEVEVCRVLLPVGQPVRLQNSKDVFFPGYHNLDFRFRSCATFRPQGSVRIAQVKHGDPDYNRNFINLDYLLKATVALYPKLQGEEPVGLVTWESNELDKYDLLYVTGRQLELNRRELKALKQYLLRGGVLLVDTNAEATNLVQYVTTLARQELGLSLEPLPKRHYLRRQPFLFAALPTSLFQQPLQMLVSGGVILVVGDLAALWGLDEQLSLPRETIRAAQELGINLLHYAWQRRKMTQLQLSIGQEG
jgi:hypothetical protein